ncbi:hypothetical protein GCM10028798_32440 [Humibacter antri]
MAEHRFALIPAAYLYLRRGDEVLLQLRQNTGFMDGMWAAAAAGHLEPGETPAAAAIREAREELGITVHPQNLIPVTAMQRTDGTSTPREQRLDWFFAATEWTGRPRVLEPAKCAGIGWFPLTEQPENTPPHERIVLNGLESGRLGMFTTHGYRAQSG